MTETIDIDLSVRAQIDQMRRMVALLGGAATARVYHDARAQHPGNLSIALALVDCLARQGRFAECHREIDGLAALDPTGIIRLANRSIIAERQGDARLAADLAVRAVSIAPTRMDIWNRLLSLAVRLNAPTDGLHWALAASQAAPTVLQRLEFQMAAAGWHIALRNLPGAIDAAAEVVRALLSSGHRPEPPVKPAINVADHADRCRRTLVDALARLEALDIKAFPVAGTLLGWQREGRFLPGDKDVDLALAPPGDLGHAAEMLTEDGLFRAEGDLLGMVDFRTFHHRSTGIAVDLVAHRQGEGCIWGGSRVTGLPDGACRLLRHQPYRLHRREWQGINLWVPEDGDALLTDYFGNWRIPDPNFDSFIAAPAMVGFPDLVRALAYQRLAQALFIGRRPLARALAKQIQTKDASDALAVLVAASAP